MEWLDSLTYTSKYTNQYLKQQQVQLHSQLNKLQKQKQKAKIKKIIIIEIERIVTDGTDINEDNDQFERAIESKHFTNGNDGLRENDSGTQLHATVNGEANSKINITKISANTPPDNVNRSDGLEENGCRTQLQAVTNKNERENHQKSKHFLPKGQLLLITTPPEVSQVKGKVVVPKQRIQPTNDHDTRCKTGQLKSLSNRSLGSPEAIANSDTPSHFTTQQEQIKRADVVPVTEYMSVKHFKGNKTSPGSKKQKQGFNSENQIEIEPDSETDQTDQLDRAKRKGR
ncbi:MAG: hypothetical protein EZS28_004781 [Streblomastix strix]|uniref:Uncharacterized protein n=1 Tax=Streblomastix strix TaxID=222440 RepID=A0A5J4WXA3_9EUKA|nr:MAG: hypothetical protein EZS28_004781 [Streblomastix strix]